MQPIQLFDPSSSSYTYVLFDEATRAALIIDPVDLQLERDLALLQRYGLRLEWTLETHVHADHITSAGLLAEHAGARTAAPAGCGIATAAMQLRDGDVLRFGSETLRALHTPGHTAGSMSFLWRNHVFTGDSLLIDGSGRTDFQSGSAEALYHSITEVLFKLPEATIVWPGHDYHGRQQSTIGAQQQSNPRIAGKTQHEFVATMRGLQLPRPARMDEAVPANLSSGIRHDAPDIPAAPPLTVTDTDADIDADIDAVRPAAGYAGDVSPQLAYRWWTSGNAVLVDVRSDAEREWVGFLPDAIALAWKQWPGMQLNPAFDAGLQEAARDGHKLLLLCRSGVRSVAAAKRATALGLEAYNILEGFEGDPDAEAHRGRIGGWRHRGLPWRQN